MPITAEQHRRRRALQNYGRNEAGSLVRKTAFRECDYLNEQLREFATEEEVLAFEAARYEDGTGHNVRFRSQPKATVPIYKYYRQYIEANFKIRSPIC